MPNADDRIVSALRDFKPGKALDLACGGGRHAMWLAELGWQVTAVDQAPGQMEGVITVTADLEQHQFAIEPAAWDCIVCWLYWQADLLPAIAAGLRQGGVAALAGKTTGRFATSLQQYRAAFPGWQETFAGEDQGQAWLIVRKP